MQWKEVEPDIKPGAVSRMLTGVDAATALHVAANVIQGVRLYVRPACREAVLRHVRSDHNEVGGLLLGQAWYDDLALGDPVRPVVLLTEAIPSAHYTNSPVSLEMGTEIWARTGRGISGDYVVGWYHSHPNLGAFFSGTDRYTQRAFFPHAYSVGWVVDPFRGEEKVFIGRESEEYGYLLVEAKIG